MVTPFIIQASSPRTARVRDAGDESLSDALQTVFLTDTERALIAWNRIYVPLNYKYDFSVMVDDVLDILEAVQASTPGNRVVHWPSNTFAAVWSLQWNDGLIKVHSEWRCVLGGTEALLASRPDIQLPSEDFVAEWKRPLQFAERALTDAGYSVAQILGLGRIRAVLAKCVRDGLLYRDDRRQE